MLQFPFGTLFHLAAGVGEFRLDFDHHLHLVEGAVAVNLEKIVVESFLS